MIHSITETRGTNGTRHWYKDGELHRAGDKPAIEWANGDREWYKDGKLHRDGGKPAVEFADGDRYWYKDGVEYTPKSK